jgi:hypothetical protein
MTTLTVNIIDDKDLPVLREILNRFGLSYTVDADSDDLFSETDIKALIQIRQDFLDGKTTARDWNDIEDDLNRAYN